MLNAKVIDSKIVRQLHKYVCFVEKIAKQNLATWLRFVKQHLNKGQGFCRN